MNSVRIAPVKVLNKELNLLTINGSIGIGADEFSVTYSVTQAEAEGATKYNSALALGNSNGYNGTVVLKKNNLKQLTDEAILEEVLRYLELVAE